LDTLKIDSVQITLDGLEKVHNQRRTHKKGYNSFNKIISNLDYLVKYAEKNLIQISIKVNVDSNNKSAFPEVFSFIKNRYAAQFETRIIDVGLNFVSNDASGESFSSCVFKNYDKINYFKYLKDSGFDKNRLLRLLEPRFSISECMMRCINSFGIGPDGNIYKCLEDFGNQDKSIGNINSKKFDNSSFAKLTVGEDAYDNKTCRNCSYLPICGGGCPYIRINTNGDNNVFHCSIYKDYLNEILNMYYILKQ
jgi:uncharacterized protein